MNDFIATAIVGFVVEMMVFGLVGLISQVGN